MKREIGSHFQFNTLLINWMNQNTGKTMRDAITAWEQIYELKRMNNLKKTMIDSRYFLAVNLVVGKL